MDRVEIAKKMFEAIDKEAKAKRRGRPYAMTAKQFRKNFEEYVQGHTRTFVTKDGDKVEIPAPLTEGGFCVFCGQSDRWLDTLERQLTAKEARTQEEEDLIRSVTRARSFFRNDLAEGAVAGTYQQNIVARILGLTDKQQVTETVRQIVVESQEDKRDIEEIRNSDV